jgi:hypothetical protein
VPVARLTSASKRSATGKTLTVRILLLQAANEIIQFQRGDCGQVRDAIVRSAHRVISLQPIFSSPFSIPSASAETSGLHILTPRA